MSECEGALKYWAKAADMFRKFYLSDHSSIADGLNKGDFETALRYYSESLDMKKRYHQSLLAIYCK
jgi:hypothetical protein